MGLKPALVQMIRSAGLDYKLYSSKLVIMPFLFYNTKEPSVEYHSGFLKSFQNLFPDISHDIEKKPIIILDPLLNGFTRPIK